MELIRWRVRKKRRLTGPNQPAVTRQDDFRPVERRPHQLCLNRTTLMRPMQHCCPSPENHHARVLRNCSHRFGCACSLLTRPCCGRQCDPRPAHIRRLRCMPFVAARPKHDRSKSRQPVEQKSGERVELSPIFVRVKIRERCLE